MEAHKLSPEEVYKIIFSGDKTQVDALLKQLFQDPTLRGKIYLQAINVGLPHEEVPEIIQETTVRLWQNLIKRNFRGESNLGTYFVSIAKNIILDVRKKSKKEPGSLDDLEIDPKDVGRSPDWKLQEEDKRKLKQTVNHLLGEIKKECSSVLINYHYLNMTMTEVADESGLKNANQAKKKADRCRQYLRKLIEKQNLTNVLKQTL
jgi:RNA polymerase sigma factor (sigma-70 family)